MLEVDMKKDLMDVLACPVCKGSLQLTGKVEQGDDVIEGMLTCPTCREDYPIHDSIPNLLPRELRS
jgi:uncharacterized protein YbaR (Trm112 family)